MSVDRPIVQFQEVTQRNIKCEYLNTSGGTYFRQGWQVLSTWTKPSGFNQVKTVLSKTSWVDKTGQNLDKTWTKPGQNLDKTWTKPGLNLDKTYHYNL